MPRYQAERTYSMKHAMREYPLYAAALTSGAPVFPGDVIMDFRGDPATFVQVTRGPEYNGTAKVVARREDESDGWHDFEVYAQVFSLLVTPHCPGCGVIILASMCEDCGWSHPYN